MRGMDPATVLGELDEDQLTLMLTNTVGKLGELAAANRRGGDGPVLPGAEIETQTEEEITGVASGVKQSSKRKDSVRSSTRSNAEPDKNLLKLMGSGRHLTVITLAKYAIWARSDKKTVLSIAQVVHHIRFASCECCVWGVYFCSNSSPLPPQSTG